jgi:hypothetical protein
MDNTVEDFEKLYASEMVIIQETLMVSSALTKHVYADELILYML